MKIEHKMIKDGSFFQSADIDFSFCASTFRFYFKFGQRNTVFFMIADRKPRHAEAFKLECRANPGWCWYFVGINIDDYPDEDPSPWTGSFDCYLNEMFNTSKPVYIWVEYE
ncbi:MAG: hypothetical protein IH831_03690 [Planctomycetes bacterium]|nr:hypothetical protein [Planctomycetota bacterium]